MLSLKIDSLQSADSQKIRDWLLETQCDLFIKAVCAEEMALQAEYSNAMLRNPLEAIAGVDDPSGARKILRRAARLRIFVEIMDEMRDSQHGFVSVRLDNP